MSEILAILNTSASPVIILLGVLLLFALNELRKKLEKIDKIDVLINSVDGLVKELKQLNKNQQDHKTESDERIKKLEAQVEELNKRLLIIEVRSEQGE